MRVRLAGVNEEKKYKNGKLVCGGRDEGSMGWREAWDLCVSADHPALLFSFIFSEDCRLRRGTMLKSPSFI